MEATDFSAIPELRHVLHKPFKWQALAELVLTHWKGESVPSILNDA